ncbi:hypothetical protein B0H34DRAFT_239173 [Crassisporium funariophilum]|nr:hypothetical protein B0H34DRAFT_239173 [Crassisporium funariophilum]
MSPSPPPSPQEMKRERVPMACLYCRQRKLKCRPNEQIASRQCKRCAENRLFCEYRPVDNPGIPASTGYGSSQGYIPPPFYPIQYRPQGIVDPRLGGPANAVNAPTGSYFPTHGQPVVQGHAFGATYPPAHHVAPDVLPPTQLPQYQSSSSYLDPGPMYHAQNIPQYPQNPAGIPGMGFPDAHPVAQYVPYHGSPIHAGPGPGTVYPQYPVPHLQQSTSRPAQPPNLGYPTTQSNYYLPPHTSGTQANATQFYPSEETEENRCVVCSSTPRRD